jgi:hypothetical protein
MSNIANATKNFLKGFFLNGKIRPCLMYIHLKNLCCIYACYAKYSMSQIFQTHKKIKHDKCYCCFNPAKHLCILVLYLICTNFQLNYYYKLLLSFIFIYTYYYRINLDFWVLTMATTTTTLYISLYIFLLKILCRGAKNVFFWCYLGQNFIIFGANLAIFWSK